MAPTLLRTERSADSNPLWVVLSNFGWFAGAELLSRLIGVVAVGFYARQLQPEMFGYLSLSVVAVSYLGLLVNFGLDLLGTREISRDSGSARRFTTNILGIRLGLSMAVYALLAGLVWLTSLPLLLKQVVWIEGLSLVALALSTSWVFQGLQEMRLPAIARVVQSLLSSALVLWLVRGPQGVLWVSLSNVVAALLASVLMLALLRRSLGALLPALEPAFAWSCLRRSLAFGVMGIAFLVYSQSGLALLGWWRPASDVGLFSSGYRLTYGLLQSFASLLLLAFLPALSESYRNAPERMLRLHQSYVRLSNVAAAGVIAAFAIFPDQVIELCFGAGYAAAAPVLRLLACCVAVSFASGPYVAALIAAGLERLVLLQTGGFALLCLFLNLLWIPSHGGVGAAWALLVSIVAGTASSIFFYRQRVFFRPRLAVELPRRVSA